MSPEDIVSKIEDLIADGYVSADQRAQVIGYADDLVIDLGRWRAFAVGVACLTGADSPDDVIIDDLPDLLGAVDRLRARAEAAEAALALACPHCGPEHFAGPDADGTCVMCMGALIRTDAAGAVLAHELYNGAHVAEAALATARAEGAAAERAAWLAELRSDLRNLKVTKADAEDYVRELIEDIEAGAHVRPVEGA